MEVAGTPKSFCNFDLELYLMESDAGLAIDFRYNTDLFDDGYGSALDGALSRLYWKGSRLIQTGLSPSYPY